VAIRSRSSGGITVLEGAEVRNQSNISSRGTITLDAASASTLTISGGLVINDGSDSLNTRTILNQSPNASVNITGGRIEANRGQAIRNENTGLITISGSPWNEDTQAGTLIISENTNRSSGTIHIDGNQSASERVVITGGTIQNTSDNENTRVVFIGSNNGRIRLGGDVTLASIAVNASATSRSGIVIADGWTGSIYALDLRVSNATVGLVQAGWWENQAVLHAASGTQITPEQIGRVTLRNFIGTGADAIEPIATFNRGYTLQRSAAANNNTANLIRNPLP
jgi:hypothetical protein